MTLPAFAPSGCLPPFLGDPASFTGRAPYRCTIPELVQALGFSSRRRELLAGLLRYRAALADLGFNGFQWIDGSFVEDKEEPGDVDVVTFVTETPASAQVGLFGAGMKAIYHCDTFIVEMGELDPPSLVEWTAYWVTLFSHRRTSLEWKGILQVALGEEGKDDVAADMLREMEGA